MTAAANLDQPNRRSVRPMIKLSVTVSPSVRPSHRARTGHAHRSAGEGAERITLARAIRAASHALTGLLRRRIMPGAGPPRWARRGGAIVMRPLRGIVSLGALPRT